MEARNSWGRNASLGVEVASWSAREAQEDSGGLACPSVFFFLFAILQAPQPLPPPTTSTLPPPNPRLPSPWTSEHSCSIVGVLYTDFYLGLVGRSISLHRTCWAAERRKGPWDTCQPDHSLWKLKACPITSTMNVLWI